ncbi:hypothetical protein LUZ61_008058 [Rhynchospora tenuis]|uniref:F-box domain-containing protein n=1 Tax=Rhynchospora tenuis TaxID=198213 RepID=A0AAD6EX33_9POAL|nr:hypothetical protein LUZ61_008058 [Rhynchospora tenuis]
MDGDDRISALPEEIKVSILSRLSIIDAVRTSVLSTSWRHLWTLLPGFRTDLDFSRDLNLFDYDPEVARSRWRAIVERLLSSLRGPIRHVRLQPPLYDESAIPTLLPFIYQKGAALEKLCLHTNMHCFQIPYFRLLKHLHLHWVRICLPADFQGFHHLTHLKLKHVKISRRDIHLLVNQSKKLTSFCSHYKLYPPDERSLSVTFNCPLLKSVYFIFHEFCKETRISSASCLESASIDAQLDAPAGSLAEHLALLAAPTMKFLSDVAHVSHLSLASVVLKCLSRVDVPHHFHLHFHQLRCLVLDDYMSYIDKRMFEMFCSLLKRMPCLELLKIECYNSEEDEELVDRTPMNEYMNKQDGFHCFDQTLRKVAVFTCKLTSINIMMWIMYFVLLNAKMLDYIEITFKVGDPQLTSSIIEELCEVEKASSNAKVFLRPQMEG